MLSFDLQRNNQRSAFSVLSQVPADGVETALFALLCLLLLSQCYLIPLAPVGPSWAVWPDLTDVVIACMAMVLPWRRALLFSPQARFLAVFGWIVLAFWIASFLVITLYALPRLGLDPLPGDPSKAKGAGIAELYRMLQCQIVLLATVSVRWTRSRLAVIGRVSGVLWFATAAFVLLTFSGVVSTTLLSHGLPASEGASGPWYLYIAGLVDSGVGAVSYNHAYTGTQLLLTAGLYLYLQRPRVWVGLLTALLLILCTFVSGSRVSLVACLPLVLPLLVLGVRRSFPAFALVLLLAVIGLVIAFPRFQQEHPDSFRRQESMSNSLEEDGFSGRTMIWKERVTFIASEPNRWLLGTGAGAALTLGNNAHMQFLQVLLELGLLGLLSFVVMQAMLLHHLWRRGPDKSILFWTNVGLLITCFSQETLYPVAAFPSFLQLYVFAMTMGVISEPARLQVLRRHSSDQALPQLGRLHVSR